MAIEIAITAPISTDRLLVGEAFGVAATLINTTNVDVLVSTNNGSTFTVVATNQTLPYSYTPTQSHVSATAVIRVRDNVVTSAFDDSDAFKITTTTVSTDTTVSPEVDDMILLKNVAQQVPVYAYDRITGLPVVDDQANMTGSVILFGGSASASGTITQADSTNHPGCYFVSLTQAQTNGDSGALSLTSSTTDVVIRPVLFVTIDPITDGELTTELDAVGLKAGAITDILTALKADPEWSDLAAIELLIDAIKAKTDNSIQKGQSHRYTNNGTGSGYDDVTIIDAP
jgi:hypothetical protein